ncbi:RNA recognition motif-containing protein 11 [Elsinoe fawcettii]|nr:RNA recognition motif-containing protein 11 [Elsinoe fawcettii]
MPDNIPVLHNQTDLAFNQMATHIGDHGQTQGQVFGQDGSQENTAHAQAEITNTQGFEAQSSHNDIPNDANVSYTSHNDGPPNLSSPSAPTPDPNVPTTAVTNVLNAPSNVPQGVPPSEVQNPLHDQVAQANTEGYGEVQDSAPADNPDYSAILNSLKSSTSAVPIQDPAPSYIPLDDTPVTQTQPISTEYNAASAGLPPRPPPQAKPAMNQNFTQAPDIRHYHPHGPANPAQTATQPMFQTGANGLPPPPVASFQQTQPSSSSNISTSPTQSQFNGASGHSRDGRSSVSDIVFDGEPKWDIQTQKEFDYFLEQERQYVTAGNWESFPMGSRLFVGNLSSERVTKRDVFHVFHRYGKLAQISIKQAYGFVQFLNAEDCFKALQAEQGSTIRGKRINLEVSKPQRNKVGVSSGTANTTRRRSRSPDRGNTDRYVGGSRQGDTRQRPRDDYRPSRNASPPRGRRDSYGRYRSRSRSPHGRTRYRSPSPRRDEDDDLPLPRRAPRDVPDVQVIIVDQIDQAWIQWLERTISSRGVKVDVLMLSPRLSEAAVIKRQIIEGVTAVSRINRFCRQTNKIPLQVFDRRGGTDVRFEEYADLDPQIAAEVVNRAKANNVPAPVPTPTYGYGYSGSTSQGPAQPAFSPGGLPAGLPAGLPPNIQSAIGNMDAGTLQKLLGAMQPGQQQQQQQVAPDLAKLLGGAMSGAQQGGYPQPPAQQQQQQQQQQNDPLAALRSNPAFAGLLGQGGAPTQQQQGGMQASQGQGQAGGGTNMADILAKLGSYKR